MEGVRLALEQWSEQLAPWVEVVARGWRVTVEVVEGRPRLAMVVLATGVSSLALYHYTTRQFDKWRALGLAYEEGHFPYGSFNIFNQKKHIFDHITYLHKKYQGERYVGWFMMGQPVLNINDPELLRIIMVKDFNHFVERSSYDGDMFKEGGQYDKLWGLQLTGAQGEEWKQLRAAFSPIFTSGRMKGMMRFIKCTADNLGEELAKKAAVEEEISLKELYGKYTMDGISASAFGMDTNSFVQKDSAFLKFAESIFKMPGWDQLMLFFKAVVPGLSKLFGIFNINVMKPKETKFFYNVIKSTLKARREGKQERRNDMVDLMMDCLKQDLTEEEDSQEQYERDMKLHVEKKTLDEDAIIATAMIFMIAGYDTTATTLSYLSYILSTHPEEQEKLQQEVDQAFEEADGQFPDYSTIQSLPYLDMVIHETLRMHSPAGLNSREASSDYSLPTTDLHLKKGQLITWSPNALHRDPAHWSHPEQFYPEHFSKEEKATRSPYAFQAFGQVNYKAETS